MYIYVCIYACAHKKGLVPLTEDTSKPAKRTPCLLSELQRAVAQQVAHGVQEAEGTGAEGTELGGRHVGHLGCMEILGRKNG